MQEPASGRGPEGRATEGDLQVLSTPLACAERLLAASLAQQAKWLGRNLRT